ncbi:hypothetical protein ABN584_06805 [Gloeocapsa sp. BRSZ]
MGSIEKTALSVKIAKRVQEAFSMLFSHKKRFATYIAEQLSDRIYQSQRNHQGISISKIIYVVLL